MSLSLGNMFRYTIKTQSELVSLRDELSHVHDYVSIQMNSQKLKHINTPHIFCPYRGQQYTQYSGAAWTGLWRNHPGPEPAASRTPCPFLLLLYGARTGQKFVDYLNDIRISRAQELLRHSDKKMYQIAHSVGYDNVKYFFRVFKKKTGESPEQWRLR